MEPGPGPARRAGSASFDGTLLERDRELSSLDTLIGELAGGAAAFCTVEGPAGIGKSRLVAQARAAAAERGITVLSASASELESGFPFGVVGQLFEPVLRSDAGQLLGGAAAPAAAIVGPDRVADQGVPVADPSFAALNGLYWLTVRLAERGPLLLAVDDLQWCDPPSLRFLAYLRSRYEGLALLVVCSIRSRDPGTDPAVVDALLGDPMAVRVRPTPLSEAATAVLLERRLGMPPEPVFTAACHRATGGNPLLLDELAKALAAENCTPDAAHVALLEDIGPPSVARTVFLRLRRLGPDAVAVAQALGALGDGASLSTVAALAGVEIDRAARVVAALARAEIVRAESPLGFVHPLVASAVYRDVLPGDRELLHLRAAELLAAGDAALDQVAGHLLNAPPRAEPWVVEQLSRAATAAVHKGAAESAVSYLERALAEPPPPDRRPDLLLALGQAQAPRDGAAAAGNLRAAYAQITDPEQRANVAGLLGRVLLFTGEGDEAVRIVREAAAALPERLADVRQELEAFELSCALFGAGEPGALARLATYRTRPVGSGVGARMLAAMAAQDWMYAGGPSDAVSELSLAALSGGDLIDADAGWAATFPLTNLTYADRDEADTWWELASAAAHRRGSLLDISAITLWRGNSMRWRGELADAERSLRTCLSVVEQWGYHASLARIYCEALLAGVLRDRGNVAGAAELLADVPAPDRADEGARLWTASRMAQLLAEGRAAAAVAAADDYADRFGGVRNPVDGPWRSVKARALDQLGRRDEALELASAELELAREWGAPSTVARSLRTLGVAAGDDGLANFEEAAAVVAGSAARLEQARALAAMGVALRRRGALAPARGPLREALEIATVCGAEALAERARTELYAAGGRPRRTALTGVGSLTASERRVAAYVAAGRTNREVGESLFITPKTVAMHLSNVYRKLGVTSRRQLSTYLAELTDAANPTDRTD